MKRVTIVLQLLFLSTLTLGTPSTAHQGAVYFDSAKVLKVTPIYHQSRQEQITCYDHSGDVWTQSSHVSRKRNNGIGKREQSHQQRRKKQKNNNRYCVVEHNSHSRPKQAQGYRVIYRYRGKRFTTFTHFHPGNRIQLEVSLKPAVYNHR